jgi:hypothetical protein
MGVCTTIRFGHRRARSALLDSLPLDIAPPMDDRPYFFHMLRLRDIFGARAPDQFRRER